MKPSQIPFDWVKKKIVEVDALQGAGCELAGDVRGESDVPPYDLSLRDGWAIDTSCNGPRHVAGEVRNGVASKRIAPDETIWINTGGALPENANAVIPEKEAWLEESGNLRFGRIFAGENVLPKGCEWKKGEVVLKKGSILGASECALLIDAGIRRISILKKPSIGILATGLELREVGTDSSIERASSDSVYLKLLLESVGLRDVSVYYAGDVRDFIASELRKLTGRHDFVVTIGGTGKGRADLIRDALRQAGASLLEEDEKLRDSAPYVRGTLDGVPVMGLPGNPLGMMVIAQRILLPLLWQKFRTVELPRIRRLASIGFEPPQERGDIVVELVDSRYGCIALPVQKGTGRSMVFKNACGVIVNLKKQELAAGSVVEVELFQDGYHLF